MPVRPHHAAMRARDEEVTFLPPETAPLMDREVLRSEERRRTIHKELVSQEVQLNDYLDEGARRLLPDGIAFEHVLNDTYTIVEEDPLSARVRCEHILKLGRNDWRIRIETASEMSGDILAFHLVNEITVFEGDTQLFSQQWHSSIPRELV